MNLLSGDLGGTKTILAVYSNDNYPKNYLKSTIFHQNGNLFTQYMKISLNIYQIIYHCLNMVLLV